MRLLSVRPDAVDALVFRGRPIQFDKEEIILPPRVVHVPANQAITVREVDADQILARYGISGVVVIADDEDEEAARLRAQRIRYDFLVRHLDNYRKIVGSQLAASVPVTLPTAALQLLNAEYVELAKEILSRDPVLKASLPTLTPRPMEDVMAEQLASFGIGKRVASATPGAATDVPGL